MQTNSYKWRFFRAGGFDQVRLDSAEDLLAIGQLDQKLWLALCCPVRGIEFDARTLAFLDSDGDGFVRAPELLAAVQWCAARLSDTAVLAQKLDGVPLAAIRSDDDEGAAIHAAARDILTDLGEPVEDGAMVTVAMASQAQARALERAVAAWQAAGAAAQVQGNDTEAAYAALCAVQAKVDDWFVRCQMAAFDPRAGTALAASDAALAQLAPDSLRNDSESVGALPLAAIGAAGVLALDSGINPAWQARIDALRALVLGTDVAALDRAAWEAAKARFAPYAAWLAARPDPASEGAGIRGLEQLARYVRDLLVFANNFVAFRDFYTRQGSATFQLGTLYLDGRSCELCVAVNDAARHAAMASLARICLVYVDCVRGAEKMSVAAAFTAGDADLLMVGRNGVFYDRKGRDWNATIVRMVEHPISLRQAFWSPYKRLARLLSEQLQKIAASKSKAGEDRMAQLAQNAGAKVGAAPAAKASAAPPTPFDVGKFAGIFAAIGLAVGALGTALATALSSLFNLRWWQMPLALAGLVLLISGPAVVLAWFKLRSRNLGPILDANGWAINARARINIPFGTSLTQVAQLPENAERSLTDPYAEKRQPWAAYLLVLAVLVALAAAWWMGYWPH